MERIPEKLIRKIENNINKIGADLREFPASADGDYLANRENCINLAHIFNWTQSFFTGMALWAYQDSKNDVFLKWAEQFKKEYADKVIKTPMETMHDVGFLYSPYAVMLYNITGDKEYKEIALRAADALAMRYEPKGGYIRAWGRMDYRIPDYVDTELAKDHFFTESRGLAIIDCMMNLPLLFWASEVTGHPYYKRIAQMHADTTIKYFVRKDYSVKHAVRFSEETGEYLGEANYCGYANDSYWSRGASWAIYGFAIAYNYTKKTEYLDVAMALLEKFMYECGENVPLWDFRLPDFEEKNIDTSAAVVVICGILEIEKHKTNEKLQKYKSMLRSNINDYINYDENTMGILKEQNGRHHYCCYGDYFLIESYMKEYSDLKVW